MSLLEHGEGRPPTGTGSVTSVAAHSPDTSTGTPRVYAAGRVRRHRATRDELAVRHEAIFEIVRANQPTGIRFSYYTATAHGLVSKTDSGYGMVQRAILAMRRDGSLPWSWIVDTNRWMRKPESWNSIEEALTETANLYRRALWTTAATAVEVWCESESVAGVIYPITSEWDVPLYPIKGQTSDTFAYGAAQQYRMDERELVILYVGDHDPHGYEIETNLRRKLVEHSGREDILWHRLACTPEDVQVLGLPGTTPKKAVWKNAFTGEHVPWTGPAVEVEAIQPPMLRERLNRAIGLFVDAHALEVAKVAEASEREVIRAIAGSAVTS